MLKGNPNVFHFTTFATADKLFAQHPIWQQAKIEAERRLIFEEYVAELKQREVVRSHLHYVDASVNNADSKKPVQHVLEVYLKLYHCSRSWTSMLSLDGGRHILLFLNLKNGTKIRSFGSYLRLISCLHSRITAA